MTLRRWVVCGLIFACPGLVTLPASTRAHSISTVVGCAALRYLSTSFTIDVTILDARVLWFGPAALGAAALGRPSVAVLARGARRVASASAESSALVAWWVAVRLWGSQPRLCGCVVLAARTESIDAHLYSQFVESRRRSVMARDFGHDSGVTASLLVYCTRTEP